MCGFLRWIGGFAFDVMCKYRPWKSATYIVLFREQVGIDVARQLHSTALNFCVVDATPEASIALARAPPRLGYVPLAQAGPGSLVASIMFLLFSYNCSFFTFIFLSNKIF